jgi:hypothetical protein
MQRPGGPPSQHRPPYQQPPFQQPPYQQPPYQQRPQHPHNQQPHHGHQPPQHQPFTAAEAHALLLDLAGAAAAATLMLVLTCWLLSLGGAFQPGHVDTHAPAAAAAKH